jgi:hypothetical protein
MKTMPNSSKLEHADTYTFKYNSDDNSIDLNTLLLSQINFATVLNEIKKEVAPGVDLAIRIRPLEKGSVPFDIILNVSWIEDIIHNSTYLFATTIVGTLVGLIQLRIWTKGKKPNIIEFEGEKVILTIGDTKLVIDKTIYEIANKNSTIDKALQKGFEAIDSDESVTGIEILDAKKVSLIDVPRESFPNIITPNEVFDEEVDKKTTTSNERLTIFKVVFEKGVKWQFYQGSRKISASINAPDFWEKINNGESFAKGDVLIVDLEKSTEFDSTLGIYIEKGFTVLNVIEHIPKGKDGQQKMFHKP